ncbi:MAG TPA: class I SAM-dependent methyltransferase [Phycisphaerae bacterium]|nr:class I SAM-dependent methyltransferase [Phycisphaerae bacterium]
MEASTIIPPEPAFRLPPRYLAAPTRKTSSGLSYIDISDEYVNWLAFANAGMLNRGNLLCFDYAIANLPSDHPIVEIGVFCGLSTNLLTWYKRRHGRTNLLFNCDAWLFEGADGNVGGSDLSHADYRSFVRESYLRNVRMFSAADLPHTIEALSDDFFARWAAGHLERDLFGRPAKLGGPISFCYIDGSHTYEAASRDFRNTDRFLEPGGFVLFDDSADGSKWEVTRVVEDVKQLGTYRLITQNPNYLFQKR